MAEVRKLDDREIAVRLIVHECRVAAEMGKANVTYGDFADATSRVARELLALSEHLKSKLPPEEKPVVVDLNKSATGKPVVVKPRTRRKATE